MDPNEAFEHILSGYMLADHAEALCGWLAGGGFAPTERAMPDCVHPFFAAHCERVHGTRSGVGVKVKANHVGVWSYDVASDDWILAARWSWLAGIED